ncbi:ubiquinone biosynthesis protein COQ9 [Hyaloscypha variabilis]
MATRTRLARLWPLSKPSALPLIRPYHSYDHPPPPGPFNPTESSILEAAIPHIPTHGFTHTTLSIGASDAGYIAASTNLFPNGAFSLVHYHLYTQRLALAKHQHIISPPPREGEKPIGIGGKVKALTWERLMGNKEIIHRWQEALALIAQPSHLPTAISELSSLSDEIWFLSGDTSVDTSWYTKRASLSAIYAATELFMTTDKSPNFDDTRDFLDRRFKDVQIVGGTMGSVTQWAGFTATAALNVLRSKGKT